MFVKNLMNNIIDLQTTHPLNGVRFYRCFPSMAMIRKRAYPQG